MSRKIWIKKHGSQNIEKTLRDLSNDLQDSLKITVCWIGQRHPLVDPLYVVKNTFS